MTGRSADQPMRRGGGHRRPRGLARLVRYWPVMHYAVGHVPWLFYPLLRWREPHRAQRAVGPATDIVVEGYVRSANTFAVIALKLAQPGPIECADHVHVPAQVIRGARMGKPILLLVRQPEDVVRSSVVKFPNIQVGHLLRGYARFYEQCWPYREHFLVATFEQVTSDFGDVIDRLNRRFGLDLTRFDHTPENVRAVFDGIDARNRSTPVTMPNLERPKDVLTAAKPSDAKESAKARVELDANPALLDRCRRLYVRYAELAYADC